MRTGNRGFTYIAVLILLFILGLTQVKVARMWQLDVQRAREAELLEIGNEFRRAIRSYYEQGPGTAKRYPQHFEELLDDKRFLMVKRHLRRIYPDPVTGKRNWGIVSAPDGGIMGVYSLSNEVPYKRAGFRPLEQGFAQASSYQGWQFVYVPPVTKP